MYNAVGTDRIEVISLLHAVFRDDFKKDLLEGLTAPQKFIPSKYFYDTYGSGLFEKICHLPEYYLTRTELSILKESAPAIMENFQDGDIIELGSGMSEKITTLLDAVYQSYPANIRYIPVDVSESALREASKRLLERYPDLRVLGIITDFTKHIEKIPAERNKILILFGSTIGNFSEKEMVAFLRNIAQVIGPDDRFLLGMDMVKQKEVLELAYNDGQGITSEFNKNILSVINREFDANFHLDHFEHVAFFHSEKNQVEMHLRARDKVLVEIKGLNLSITMKKGETIRTEISRKFTVRSAETIIAEAGLIVNRWFFDPHRWFSLVEVAKPTSELWKRHLKDQIAQRRARKENLRKCRIAGLRKPLKLNERVYYA